MNDKLEQHHGLQLSALMDGELAPDEARFLLRRLQHDDELADRWERWQLAGEVLRGRADALLPGGFADRVGEALRTEAAPVAPTRRPGLLRWGGIAALAASVAVVALMVPRPAPDAPDGPEPRIAAAGSGRVPVQPDAFESPDAGPRVIAPVAIEAPAVEPSRDGPRATASGRSSVRVASRAATAFVDAPARAAPAFERAGDPVAAPRQLAVQDQERAPRDPFSDAPLVPSRPWPRAVLPQFGNGGALATGLPGNNGAQAPSFYPFEPRLPAQAAEPVPEPGAEPQAPY